MKRASLIVLSLLAVLLLFGCGKKGNPRPDDERDVFKWASQTAQLAPNGCLTITGTLSGNVANLTDVVFELQPLPEGGSCEGCPFTPTERVEFSEQALRGHPEVNTIRLTYCPREQTPSYLWRLVGINIHRRFPYAITPIQTFAVKEEPETNHAPFYLP